MPVRSKRHPLKLQTNTERISSADPDGGQQEHLALRKFRSVHGQTASDERELYGTPSMIAPARSASDCAQFPFCPLIGRADASARTTALLTGGTT